MVVEIQLYHLGSDGQRDDRECDRDLSGGADQWAESTGLVGEPVVCEQYVWQFNFCVMMLTTVSSSP